MERYDGYFFRIINKAVDDGALREDVDIVILSAEFGLLDTDEPIPMYDREMTSHRADELREEVIDALTTRVRDGQYDEVVINMAKEYERAIKGIDSKLDIEITRIDGGGIGEKGHTLKHFIRTDSSTTVGGV
jgi:cytoplasmic iron level regulating protein YaaA (DUF328/UPF0246 family)